MPKAKDPSYEATISVALEAMAADSTLSLNRASQVYEISKHTLRRRRAQGLSRRDAHEPRMLLSMKQEEELMKWISQLIAIGSPPTYDVIRQMAGYVAVQNGRTTHVGKRWMERFRNRHPELATLKHAARKVPETSEVAEVAGHVEGAPIAPVAEGIQNADDQT